MDELLKWDEVGKHLYEIGVRRGVLYVQDTDGTYGNGEAWNGLSAVTQSPSGAEPTKIYADDINYLNVYSAEEFGATIEAYTYPEGFALCNGEASIADGVTIGQCSLILIRKVLLCVMVKRALLMVLLLVNARLYLSGRFCSV